MERCCRGEASSEVHHSSSYSRDGYRGLVLEARLPGLSALSHLLGPAFLEELLVHGQSG
jgi:hypothetical protein